MCCFFGVYRLGSGTKQNLGAANAALFLRNYSFVCVHLLHVPWGIKVEGWNKGWAWIMFCSWKSGWAAAAAENFVAGRMHKM